MNTLKNHCLISAPNMTNTLFEKSVVYICEHNIGGAIQLAKFLKKNNKNTWLIVGMLNNKNITLFLKSLKKYIAGIIAIKIPGEKNAYTTEEISDVCKKLNIFCIKQKNIISAQNYLLNNIIPERILITGSLYLVGKARRLFI